MSDIGILSSPGDTSFILGILLLIVLAGALLISLLVAWLKSSRTRGRIADQRFFGYFIGTGCSLLATLLYMGMVELNNEGVFAGWSDDWAFLWIGSMVAIGGAAGYWWNRSRQQRG